MAETFCKGDCLKCSFQQQVYCAAQRSYAMMENQKIIVEYLEKLTEMCGTFSPKTDIINPFLTEAQSSDGAENRSEVTQ